MSGHKRVKDIAYEDDDFDDYYEDDYAENEELSQEDQEQMNQGKIKVKEVLGSSFSVTDKEIEDALWNYYYDIPKSVTFLKNLRPAQSKKQPGPKATSKPAQSSQKKNGPVSTYPGFPSIQCPPPYHSTAGDFFADTPWLKVPTHLRGNLVELPLLKGGLLGGSSKPSKLAALAAKRKQKESEKAGGSLGTQPSEDQSSKAVALLDKLNLKPSNEEAGQRSSQPQLATGKNESVQISKSSFSPRNVPSESEASVESVPSSKKESPQTNFKEVNISRQVEIPRAAPSPFASTLMGVSNQSQNQIRPLSGIPRTEDSLFQFLYSHNIRQLQRNPFADPSPDDVVLNAQSKGPKTGKGPAKQASGEKVESGLAQGMSTLTTEDTPKIKSKNLDVKKEYEKSQQKKTASFIVIGHVDHGKSTLMGRLLYDLKVVDQRSVEKLKKEASNIGKSSFAFAWVMDETSEERERGITVDIATNYFETEHTRFTILDAPGHQDFIPNMIAGASQADFAVLVIDSGNNSFEAGLKGQTKEHVLLVKSMGVQRLVVAVNKMDTVGWSQDRFEEIEQQMSAFFKTAGFLPKNVTFVPCAGLTGDNIVRSTQEDAASWYKGRTLVAELESTESSKRALDQPLRMSISDIFRGGVTNPLSVSGRLDSGTLQIGDQVIAMPSGEKATIKGIEIDKEPADWAVAGQIAVLHVTDIDPANLRTGDIICSLTNPIKNTQSFVCQILAFEHILPSFVDVHRGRLHAPARVTKLIATLDKKTGQIVKKKPRVIQPGSVARIVVEMDSAIPLESRDKIVLRSEGQTIAAGLLDSTTE